VRRITSEAMKQEIERVVYYYLDQLTSSRAGLAVEAVILNRKIPGLNPSSDKEKKKIVWSAHLEMHVIFFKPKSSPS
jgi:hypothetical protein